LLLLVSGSGSSLLGFVARVLCWNLTISRSSVLVLRAEHIFGAHSARSSSPLSRTFARPLSTIISATHSSLNQDRVG
jgi:hypothetical protein